MISLKQLAAYMESLVTTIPMLKQVVDLEVMGTDAEKYKHSPVLEWEIERFNSDIVPTITVTIRYVTETDRSDTRDAQDIAIPVLSDVIWNMRNDALLSDESLEIIPAEANSDQWRGFTFSAEIYMQQSICN